jgi:hypothetical protein
MKERGKRTADALGMCDIGSIPAKACDRCRHGHSVIAGVRTPDSTKCRATTNTSHGEGVPFFFHHGA